MDKERTTGVSHNDVYTIVTEKIINQLEKGTVPWLKPWTDSGLPRNIISGKPYRGLNVILLAMEGYERNDFITFKQLQEIGGKVRKGEKGHMVVFWSQIEKAAEDIETPENEKPKKKSVLRYYTVFNLSQCDNIPERYLSTIELEVREIPSCDEVIANMPLCPSIKHAEQRAYYHPKDDFINMPKKKSFKTNESYYSTLFHELVHSTGHEKRLNRSTLTDMSEFGGETYSKEELVAEIGACYLHSLTALQSEFVQSTAYIQGWLTKLKNDKRCIVMAAGQAQAAVDFILNRTVQNEE